MNLSDLVGKTIISVEQYKLKKYDDIGFLIFTFSDKSSIIIESKYGNWTGKSIGEYQTLIDLYSSEKRIKELEKL